MGLYDSINFTCPRCRNNIEVQSKAGECSLTNFSPRSVPVAIADDIDGQHVYCEKCDGIWIVVSAVPKRVACRLARELDGDERRCEECGMIIDDGDGAGGVCHEIRQSPRARRP